MFGGHPGPWKSTDPWNGWWGTNPPFHHPVFVITHHARQPLTLEGETTFMFVTDGIESALAQARTAAGPRDIRLGGGANVARQFLTAGLVDEMVLNLVPILLGSGERLFEGVDDLGKLALVRTVAAPGVTHLVFARG
jgi:dihydrofolate reductase